MFKYFYYWRINEIPETLLVYEKKAHFAYSKIPSSAQTVGSLLAKKDLVGVADRLQVLVVK